MGYIQKWKNDKIADDVEHTKRLERRKKKEEATTAAFLKVLKNYDVSDFWTNGYVYEFVYNRMVYHFVNQTNRLCCNTHRPFTSDDDEECFRDMQPRMEHGEAPEYVREYQYSRFIINEEAVQAFRELIGRHECRVVETKAISNE